MGSEGSWAETSCAYVKIYVLNWVLNNAAKLHSPPKWIKMRSILHEFADYTRPQDSDE